jgi:hypothetical protein
MLGKKRLPFTTSTHESIDEFRTFLGPSAAQYADSELRQVQIEIQVLTDTLLDLYAERLHRNGVGEAQKHDLDSSSPPA